MTKAQLQRLFTDAACLLVSTVFTGNRILTDRQKKMRRKIIKAANKLPVPKKRKR